MTFSNLDHPIRWLFFTHALAGALALLILAIPLFSKKGGKLHVLTGWIYTVAMIFVGLSSFVITPWRYFFDPQRNISTQNFSIFLFYIAIFTLSTIAYGISVLKAKNRKEPSLSFIHMAPSILTFLTGIATQLVGVMNNEVLLMLFPFLGHASAFSYIQYWRKAPTEKMHWWYAHMNGMFTACIATITAFLVTALPRIWPEANSPVLWIAPGVILGTFLNFWVKKYQKNFEKT